MLCNPPYVRNADIARLAPEIAWEPRCALDGGADGLDGFRAVAGGAARLLAADGVAAFEIGDGQARAVGDLMRAAGFGAVVKHRGPVRRRPLPVGAAGFAAADIGCGANPVRFPSIPFLEDDGEQVVWRRSLQPNPAARSRFFSISGAAESTH